jgi:hypothetical protein
VAKAAHRLLISELVISLAHEKSTAHRLLISELVISLAHEKSTAIRSREMLVAGGTQLHSRGHHKLLVASILAASFRRPAARHFQLSILHNIGHSVFGVAGLLLARTASGHVTTWWGRSDLPRV